MNKIDLTDRVYYVYTYSKPDGEAFYVGKGKNRRMYDHLNFARRVLLGNKKSIERPHNRLNIGTIIELLEDDSEPIITKVRDKLSEQEAYDLEIELISKHGRIDLNSGTLTNLDGGGGSPRDLSDESREKIR